MAVAINAPDSPRTRRTSLRASPVTGGSADEVERLVKSVERVRDLGEVFTPAATVQAMLDLLPDSIWDPHPAATFLEPACGDGNFVVAVLDRKLDRIRTAWQRGELNTDSGRDVLELHALEALSSIYAIDISADNIIGGTPGHEIGARGRLVEHLHRWFAEVTGTRLTTRSPVLRSATWIVDHNIQVANMLPFNADGTPSGRDQIPLVEYRWNPATQTVALLTTTLGAVIAETDEEATGTMSLFATPEPAVVWDGPATRLHQAPVPTPTIRVQQTSNGCRRR